MLQSKYKNSVAYFFCWEHTQEGNFQKRAKKYYFNKIMLSKQSKSIVCITVKKQTSDNT